MSRSCGGTDGQVDKQMGKEEVTDREERRMEAGEGASGRPPPDRAPPGQGRRGAAHLFEPLHVLEVESDVEKTQVGVDELELNGAGGVGRSPCWTWPAASLPRRPAGAPAAHQDHFDDKMLLVGALQPVILWGAEGGGPSEGRLGLSTLPAPTLACTHPTHTHPGLHSP